jgi:N-carbamoylputrescine amidase
LRDAGHRIPNQLNQLNELNQRTSMKDIRIATVIFNSIVNRTEHNLNRMGSWIKAARKQGAGLVCFPELNVTGYSNRPEIKDSAEPIPGPASQCLQQMARTEHIVILAGMAEKDKKGRIFASHLVMTPQGISGIYRKLHIAPSEKGLFSPGNKVPLFDIQGIKFGIQLCYDAHFPELSSRMAVDGAEIIFVPHASPRGTPQGKLESWMRHLPARAFDNSVFVVACNQTGKNRKGLEFPGISVILEPSGDILKKNAEGQENILLADLKAGALKKIRDHKMRYFLPNRRPELY